MTNEDVKRLTADSDAVAMMNVHSILLFFHCIDTNYWLMIRDWSGEYFMQCYILSFFSVSHSLVCFLIPLLLIPLQMFWQQWKYSWKIGVEECCWSENIMENTVFRSTRHFVLYKIIRILAIHEHFYLDWLDAEQKCIIYFVRTETIVRSCHAYHFIRKLLGSNLFSILTGVLANDWASRWFFFLAEVYPVLNPHWKHPTGL